MTDNKRLAELLHIILSDIRQQSDAVWNVYILVNHNKKEIYFGVAMDVADRYQDHARKQTDALKHWNFSSDTIAEKVPHTGFTQEAASAKAHGYEQEYKDGIRGYTVIQTAGI